MPGLYFAVAATATYLAFVQIVKRCLMQNVYMSLHRILSLFALTITGLAIGAAISLMLLTAYLHRTTVRLETAFQSVRLAEEMQIDLLDYIQARDSFSRIRVENDLRRKLHQARQYANQPEETALLQDVERLIEAHFVKNRQVPVSEWDESNLERAFDALRKFIGITPPRRNTI